MQLDRGSLTDQLTDPEVQTIFAILRGGMTDDERRKTPKGKKQRKAWMNVAALAAKGHDEATLAGLIASGWLAEWCPKGGRAVSLTPWAAYQAQHHIGEHWIKSVQMKKKEDAQGNVVKDARGKPVMTRVHGIEEEQHWEEEDATNGKPRPFRLPVHFHETRFADLPWWSVDDVADAAPSPADEAQAREECVMEDAVTASGQLDVDAATGKVRRVPVLLWGQTIPIARKRRARRAARGCGERPSR